MSGHDHLWEHPRVRGEDISSRVTGFCSVGTPPRARGRRLTPWAGTPNHGNTPACAGKTRWCGVAGIPEGEHPRVRGEDLSREHLLVSGVGTPPRARGRLPYPVGARLVRGNTPACAGKTPVGSRLWHCPREHPRVRGEDTFSLSVGDAIQGTPPRARGRHNRERLLEAVNGNTPACAGKTRTENAASHVAREHPRVRGEDFLRVETVPDSTGTPPRARGRRR